MNQDLAQATATSKDVGSTSLPTQPVVPINGHDDSLAGKSNETSVGGTERFRPLTTWEETTARLPDSSAGRATALPAGNLRQRLWREAAEGLDRIRVDPAVMSGVPVVRDTRISVAQLLDMLTDTADLASVLDEFPGRLELDDLHEVVAFAARLSR